MLLDWEDTVPAAARLSYQDRMNDCVDRFLHGIPEKNMLCDSKERQVWVNALRLLAKCLKQWWSSWSAGNLAADALPSETDFTSLQNSMDLIATDACHASTWCREAQVQAGSSGDSQTLTQSAPARRNSEPAFPSGARMHVSPPDLPEGPPMTFQGTPDPWDPVDVTEAEVVMQRLTNVVGSAAASVPVGQAAARALVADIIARRRRKSQLEFRHEDRIVNFDANNQCTSIPLHLRQQQPDGLKYHGGPESIGRRKVHRPIEEGNDLSIIFALILHFMKDHGYIGRMPEPPLVTTSVDRFHSQYWGKFLEGEDRPWASLTPQQKSRHVRSWLFKKFTMDPRGLCMLPTSGQKRLRRNEASWKGLDLTDAELDNLVQSVMGAYFRA